jgi:DNA-binding XRE family transcriptional regulator
MANHPNRSGRGESRNPKPKEVISLRLDAGLSQTAAAEMVHTSCRTWQQWEAEEGSAGHRRMHPAFWELFRIKVRELSE